MLEFKFGILRKARQTLYITTLIQLYYSFLYPYLSSGIIIWGQASDNVLSPLVIAQKRAIRLIYGEKARVHIDRASISVLYTETDATVCKFLACPNKSSNHYKKPSPVHISGLNIVKHTKVTHRTYFQAWKA